MAYKCSTCGTNVLAKTNFVKFMCPDCGKELIVRCSTCKTSSSKYTCAQCGFVGP